MNSSQYCWLGKDNWNENDIKYRVFFHNKWSENVRPRYIKIFITFVVVICVCLLIYFSKIIDDALQNCSQTCLTTILCNLGTTTQYENINDLRYPSAPPPPYNNNVSRLEKNEKN